MHESLAEQDPQDLKTTHTIFDGSERVPPSQKSGPTYTFRAENFLDHRNTICSSFSTACPRPSENVFTFQSKWYGLCLNQCGSSKTQVRECSKQSRIEQVRERGKRGLGIDEMRLSHRCKEQRNFERTLNYDALLGPRCGLQIVSAAPLLS